MNDAVLRYLADLNPTIPFSDRWPIVFNGPLFMIVGQSQPNDPFYTIVDRAESKKPFCRALADQNPTTHFHGRWPTVLNDPIFAIVGLSESLDSLSTIVGRPFLIIPFLRYLTDRNPTILVAIAGRSFLPIPFYYRWPIFFNDPTFAIVGLSESNDSF